MSHVFTLRADPRLLTPIRPKTNLTKQQLEDSFASQLRADPTKTPRDDCGAADETITPQ